jgi:hypothetical protein
MPSFENVANEKEYRLEPPPTFRIPKEVDGNTELVLACKDVEPQVSGGGYATYSSGRLTDGDRVPPGPFWGYEPKLDECVGWKSPPKIYVDLGEDTSIRKTFVLAVNGSQTESFWEPCRDAWSLDRRRKCRHRAGVSSEPRCSQGEFVDWNHLAEGRRRECLDRRGGGCGARVTLRRVAAGRSGERRFK